MVAEQIGKALRALAPGFSALGESAVLIAGAALIAYGAWQAYPPAGPIVGGILLIAGVILKSRGSG